jgi:uncharacterized protein YecT (DUF1311 family)
MKSIQFACAFALYALSLGCDAFTTASPSHGKDDAIGLRPSYDQCLDAPSGDVPGWFECTAAEYKYQDARLNKTYKALIAKLGENEKTALRDGERVWVSNRDALCALNNDAANGRSINSNDCAVQLTARRASLLESATPTSDIEKLAPPMQGKLNWKDILQAFATGGNKILAYQIGFLTGDELPDAVLVLDPPDNGNDPNNGPPRTVVVLVRNASGELEIASRNDKIVPCAKCGGMHMDDPFSFMRIANKRFFIVTEGGDRYRWGNTYIFKAAVAQKDWLLNYVQRGVSDTDTQKNKHIELYPKDFGTVKFSGFNPDKLPNVKFK